MLRPVTDGGRRQVGLDPCQRAQQAGRGQGLSAKTWIEGGWIALAARNPVHDGLHERMPGHALPVRTGHVQQRRRHLVGQPWQQRVAVLDQAVERVRDHPATDGASARCIESQLAVRVEMPVQALAIDTVLHAQPQQLVPVRNQPSDIQQGIEFVMERTTDVIAADQYRLAADRFTALAIGHEKIGFVRGRVMIVATRPGRYDANDPALKPGAKLAVAQGPDRRQRPDQPGQYPFTGHDQRPCLVRAQAGLALEQCADADFYMAFRRQDTDEIGQGGHRYQAAQSHQGQHACSHRA